MTGHNFGAIAVQYEEGVLDSCSPAIFTKIVRQDFLRLSIKLPDTVSITRENEKSDTLIIRDIEDDTLHAKITSFANPGALAAFKARGCRITHIRVYVENSAVEDASSTPKRARPTRSLPAANHKASGFTAYRSNTAKGPRPSAPSGSSLTTRPPVDKGLPSSQPVGLARSLRANAAAKNPPPSRSLPRPGRSPTATRQDSDSHAHSPSLATPASEPRGTKRKLDDSAYVDELLGDGDGDGDDGDDDDSEIVILGVSEPDNTISSGGDMEFEMGFENLYPELQATPKAANTTVVEAEPLVVPNSKEWSGTATHNKVRDLVSAALEKAVEGEKQRVVLEAHLRQEIISLESRLQRERADHNFTKRRILDLEEGLTTITSNVERTNALIQATSVQLLKDNCEAGGELSK